MKLKTKREKQAWIDGFRAGTKFVIDSVVMFGLPIIGIARMLARSNLSTVTKTRSPWDITHNIVDILEGKNAIRTPKTK